MSKTPFPGSTTSSPTFGRSGDVFSSPKLFARRSSKAAPFVISSTDSPYQEKPSFDFDNHQGYHHAQDEFRFGSSKAGNSSSSSSAVSGKRVLTGGATGLRMDRRNRRVVALGLLTVALLALTFWRSGGADESIAARAQASSYFSRASKLALWGGAAKTENKNLKNAASAQSDANLGVHTFHPNGLLLVNPQGRHPIHVLIEHAEKKWRTLLQKQSTNLDSAVQEYKQRYRRNPPKGFEHWWNFAKSKNVVLVDEYDQIARDLEPYWALEPADLRHRSRVMTEREHTFTLNIKDGKVTRTGIHSELRRATDMQKLIQPFAKFVPGEVNMTFIIDDNPAVMMGWNQRERMLELASQGEYWGPSEFIEPDDEELSNFARACPPNSALRHSEQGGSVSHYGSEQGTRSFIHDHSKAVDLCSHPEFRSLHGHTAGQGLGLTPLVPLFSWAKTGMHSDVLVTPLEQYDDDYLVYDPPFEYKTQNKLMWRGSTTGTEFRTGYNWKESQRARLHYMSAAREGTQEVLWSDHGAMQLMNASTASVNPKYFDMRFSGVPAQCDPETCKIMEETIDFAPTMGLEQQNQYRYLMDVDGNGWSGRFHRLLSTNAVVLKSTVFPEWYQDRIVPWVHYVPIKVDYSDLHDVMAFFIGNPDGEGAHDSMAARIGQAGKDFAKKHWRREDMQAYMFRLIMEYSRLLNRESDIEIDYYHEAY